MEIDSVPDKMFCDMYYNITDDIGETHNYYKRDFIDLSKFREDKLNELGI